MKNLLSLIMMMGAVVLMVGLLTYMTRWELSPYLYIVGSTMFAAALLFQPVHTDDFAVRRLARIQKLGGLCLVASAVFMFINHRNDWIVFLAIAAFILLYTAFRISYIESRQQS